jgi:DNA-binding transcriptional ArsR family regulator
VTDPGGERLHGYPTADNGRGALDPSPHLAPGPSPQQVRPALDRALPHSITDVNCRSTGYGAWWPRYVDAGWVPLRLPRGRKEPPPTGFTGAGAGTPDEAQQAEWSRRWPDSNIAIRMPAGVLGIDVDDYPGKHGGRTIAALEERLGPLPPTYTSTSRHDGARGIGFYQVRVDQGWKGVVAADHPDGSRTADVDLIHSGYRYAVVAPSLHPEGRQYVWRDPAGAVIDQPPAVPELPELPHAWVEALSSTGAREARQQQGAPSRTGDWVGLLPDEKPCAAVAAAQETGVLELRDGSRHDAVRRSSLKLLRLASLDHSGVGPALHRLQERFLEEAVDRSEEEARAEWSRLLLGAARQVRPPRQELMCQCTRDLFEDALRGTAGFNAGVAGTSEREVLRQLLAWARGSHTVRASQRQLGEAIGKKQPHVARVLDRLCRLGWLERVGVRRLGEGSTYRLALPAVMELSVERRTPAGSSADNSLSVTRHWLFGPSGLGRGPAETWAALPALGPRFRRGLIGVPTKRASDRGARTRTRASRLDFRPGRGATVTGVATATGKSPSTVRRHLQLLKRETLVVRDSAGTWWRLTFEPVRVAAEIGVVDRTPTLSAENKRDRLAYYGRRARPESEPGHARLRQVESGDESLIVDTSTGAVVVRAESPEDVWLLDATAKDSPANRPPSTSRRQTAK